MGLLYQIYNPVNNSRQPSSIYLQSRLCLLLYLRIVTYPRIFPPESLGKCHFTLFLCLFLIKAAPPHFGRSRSLLLLLSPAPPHHDTIRPSFSSVPCALLFALLPVLIDTYTVIDLLQAIPYTGSWLSEWQRTIATDSIQGNNR